MVRNEKLQKAFGAVLREARERADMSQEKLALAAGIDRSFLSLLERGQRQPSLTTLFRLAAILRVRPSQLIASVERRFPAGLSG